MPKTAPRRNRSARGARARRSRGRGSTRGSRQNRSRTREITARKRQFSSPQPSRELTTTPPKFKNPFGVIGRARRGERS